MGGNSDFPRDSQHVGTTVSVLCDIHTTLCAVPKHHVHTTLTLLVVLQTILGQSMRARMLRVRQLQLRGSHVLGDCVSHASSQPIFSETVSMVPVQTSRAECALDHD